MRSGGFSACTNGKGLICLAGRRIGPVGREEHDLIVDAAAGGVLVVPGFAENVHADAGGGEECDVEVDKDGVWRGYRVSTCTLRRSRLPQLVGSVAVEDA